MSSTAQSDRVNSLLAQVDEAIKSNELQKAAETLREASHLDPENAEVKARWTALQKQEDSGNVLALIRDYLSTDEVEFGQSALQALRQKELPPHDAEQTTELLLHAKGGPELLDTLTATLLSRNVPSRRAIATKLSANATEIFELTFLRGEETFRSFASIPLENTLWTGKEQQETVQKDVFRLSVAKLIDAGAENLSRVMKCIARLLTLVPEIVAPIVDADVLDAIVLSLDIRLAAILRSQAMLATSKLLEATKERGEQLFSDFITERVAKQTNEDLILAFSAAAALFPVIPAVAAKLFLIDGFVQQLVPNLEKNWEEGAAGKRYVVDRFTANHFHSSLWSDTSHNGSLTSHRKSNTLETAALELLSAACVEKSCREAIKRYCAPWLENLAEEGQGSHQALAALILAKIDAESGENITAKLEQLVLSGDSQTEQAIEGLAYTTLQANVKEEVAANEKLILQLVQALKEQLAVCFGCLTVFSNLTAYRLSLSEEQKKLSQLKAYANSSKPAPVDPLDDDTHVNARCKKILDANVVPALVACCKQTTSPTNVALVVRIILALAKEQKNRAKMTQQGAVKLLLHIRDRIANTDKSTSEASVIGREAAHALARLLISTNPSHIFSSSLPASSAVSGLVPLLSQDQDNEQRNLLPTFEALLALTNLASMEDNSIRDLQLRLLWSELEDHLLFSSNTLVQRASVELVCNLMASPTCVAKFVGDGSKREATRMRILLALADVEDFATRRAAGGALAMLTEWDAAVTAILDQKLGSGTSGIQVLLDMCADESDEMKHRGFACVTNVANTPGETGKHGVEQLKQEGGVSVLQEALKNTKNREVLAVGVEVLKLMM